MVYIFVSFKLTVDVAVTWKLGFQTYLVRKCRIFCTDQKAKMEEFERAQSPQESYKTGWLVIIVNMRKAKVLTKMTLVIN